MLPFLPPIAAAISLMVGHPVAVTCAANGYEGTVETSALVQVSPLMCHQYASPYDDPYGAAASASGLLVVIHEAEHILHPDASEHDAECYALADYVSFLGRLHVPRRRWAPMLRAAVSADRFYFGLRSADC
jgi:hypothetical protein